MQTASTGADGSSITEFPYTVTIGLASHWPCVSDAVVYPLTGSMA